MSLPRMRELSVSNQFTHWLCLLVPLSLLISSLTSASIHAFPQAHYFSSTSRHITLHLVFGTTSVVVFSSHSEVKGSSTLVRELGCYLGNHGKLSKAVV